MNLCTLVVCGAPLAARAHDIAAHLVSAGWTVQAITTADAHKWVDADALADATEGRTRSEHRSIDTPRSPDRPSVVVIAPATFNTVNKLAMGIADTYVLATLCEVLGGGVPIVAVPMVASRLWHHPMWTPNLARLTAAGVRWVSIHDGALGEPQMMEHGTGPRLVARFDPAWIAGHLA